MQNYSKPESRNTMRAAGGMSIKDGGAIPGPVGSNQTQGKGEIPGKVPVPMPGTDATQKPYKGGGMKGNVPGFQGGEIPGKV
jgi:hypothetical protein